MIQHWRRESAKLEAVLQGHKGRYLKVRSLGVGTSLSNEVELDILAWVNGFRQEGVPVSPRMLSLQARLIAARAGAKSFRASDKWINGFKHTYRLSMRAPTRQSQVSPDDSDKVATEFAIEVEKMALQLGVTRRFNADQAAAFSEYLPMKRTINKRGSKTVWVKSAGASKERATVILLGDSNGTKYMPFIIFKMKPSINKKTKRSAADLAFGRGQRSSISARTQDWKYLQMRNVHFLECFS
ncbi:hypothetical protein JG687_00017315 [Phytophthora cactorum]|uniref:HTH CENPB-type domain-containing protein n=1 Tax=Phytophthora cactorum TaxID=29920 RepID=A0A8T1TRM9_9STRA|nr:hypothetical protein JG687_00017315 [Phytophthora cactorum]